MLPFLSISLFHPLLQAHPAKLRDYRLTQSLSIAIVSYIGIK